MKPRPIERTRLKPVLPPFFIIPLQILPYQAHSCPDILTVAESVAAYCHFGAQLKEVFIIRVSCASHHPAALCRYWLITTYSCHSLYIFECIVVKIFFLVNKNNWNIMIRYNYLFTMSFAMASFNPPTVRWYIGINPLIAVSASLQGACPGAILGFIQTTFL